MDWPHLKFHGLAWTCICALSQSFAHLPHMGMPMGQKLVTSGSTWARFCGTHISEIPGWICAIRTSMELSRPVFLQHHGDLTLTLDYLRNGRADWHGSREIWIDRMLDPHCDFEHWPHPWPWPLIFKVKFSKSRNFGMGCLIDMEWKGWGPIGYRNWYQDWGHCGVTNDLGSSPQPEGEARWLW